MDPNDPMPPVTIGGIKCLQTVNLFFYFCFLKTFGYNLFQGQLLLLLPQRRIRWFFWFKILMIFNLKLYKFVNSSLLLNNIQHSIGVLIHLAASTFLGSRITFPLKYPVRTSNHMYAWTFAISIHWEVSYPNRMDPNFLQEFVSFKSQALLFHSFWIEYIYLCGKFGNCLACFAQKFSSPSQVDARICFAPFERVYECETWLLDSHCWVGQGPPSTYNSGKRWKQLCRSRNAFFLCLFSSLQHIFLGSDHLWADNWRKHIFNLCVQCYALPQPEVRQRGVFPHEQKSPSTGWSERDSHKDAGWGLLSSNLYFLLSFFWLHFCFDLPKSHILLCALSCTSRKRNNGHRQKLCWRIWKVSSLSLTPKTPRTR